MKLKNSSQFIFLLPLAFVICIILSLTFSPLQKYLPGKKLGIQKPSTQQVAGTNNVRSPQIFIYGGDQGLTSGGVIALASTDEPAVQIGGYNITGNADVAIYKADENALLSYLTHDKEGKQTNKTPDASKMSFIANVKHPLKSSYGENKVPLPLEETGIWYLKVNVGSTTTHAFIIRSNTGVISEEGENELIFWGQNFTTKRSVSEGTLKILNLQDGIREIGSTTFNSEGIAKTPISIEGDVAVANIQGNLSIVPLNLKYLNDNYSYAYKNFSPKPNYSKYFIFTDRPIYKPGDTVEFKAILRNDDDARYSIPTGAAKVTIYKGYYYEGSEIKPAYEKTLPISPDGTINGTYKIPKNDTPGYHTLYVNLSNQTTTDTSWSSERSTSYISFNVENYRKPEFFLNITSPKPELIASQNTTFNISGEYFSGQPLIGQKIKYTVYASDFYEYEYVADYNNISYSLSQDYRYGSWYGSNKVLESTVTLNRDGQATIKLPTKMGFNHGKSQVFSIDATIDDGSIDPAFARKNILVYAGEFGIYRNGDSLYSVKVKTPINVPILLIPHLSEKVNIANVPLTATIKRESWIPYQEKDKKYLSYKREEETLPKIKVNTNKEGKADISFTPNKVGYYTITLDGKDNRGNTISKVFYSYVYSEGESYYSQDNDTELNIKVDKEKYKPNETGRFSIYSSIPDRDVFLAVERGRVQRYQVVHIDGKNANIDIDFTDTDIPNVYVKISSFSNYELDTSAVNVPVSAESKKLKVKINPSSKVFGPGERVSVDITTTDLNDKPVTANIALWLVDKAIYELAENNLGDIFDTFWKERYNTTASAHSLEGILVQQAEQGGGCFAAGTPVLMANGTKKAIETVLPGDYILTRLETDKSHIKARVASVHKAEVGGYLIINSNLRVTDNHIMWVNNSWKTAGSIQIGDTLNDSIGKEINVTSLEWQRGKFNVYNLEVEKYHTYFANGIWVHNQKGAPRKTFEDTAYWNPEIKTNSSGKARVSFTLPDNLTTWAMAAVGSTNDTMVGQTTDEIVVTKDIIVRPILPNILRIGDTITLSALTQNFSGKKENFNVDLKFNSGQVAESVKKDISIETNGMERLFWEVKPTKVNTKAKLTFTAAALNSSTSDTIVQEIPVLPFGFTDIASEAGQGNKTYSVNLSKHADKEKSSIKLSLASTIIGSLPQAMSYLIQYPYGCVEQTTSRFVPAVIAKINSGLFPDQLKDKNIDDYIDKGILRLSSLQRGDGGWTWWFTGNSDPYITSYVVEYILMAKQSGTKVDESILSRAENYLTYAPESITNEHNVARAYGLTLLGSGSKQPVYSLSGLTPDYLALAVMNNYLNGDKDQNTNGLAKLISMAKKEGDALYWDSGNEINFGSIDASTALAVRAIVMADGERNIAEKGILYLTRTRARSYWSNTYATSQVIRSFVEFSKTGSELKPNYSYSIKLDGNEIAKGSVSSTNPITKEVIIPVDHMKNTSSISVEKKGSGQIYSTLTNSQYITDRNAKPLSNGVYIKREYVNEKGDDYSLGIGDTVQVMLTVGGLNTTTNYAVIQDELPSGMIPVNEKLLNEQYGNSESPYDYDIIDKEVTQNGMILSIYELTTGERTYTYNARVISNGSFTAPPASVSLMYKPEVNGRTGVQKVTTVVESSVKFEKKVFRFISQFLRITVGILIFGGILGGLGLIMYGNISDVSNADKRRSFIMRLLHKPQNTTENNDKSMES